MKKSLIVVSVLVLAAIVLPITMISFKKQQELRSHAAAATVLYFTPTTNSINPLQKKIGDTVSLDVMVSPSSNYVSLVTLAVQFDPSKFQPAANALVVNTAAFPTVAEGPVIDAGNGKILISLSIGADVTKAIRTNTKVATINLTAINSSDFSPSVISFGTQSQVYSAGPSDQYNENVLATATPAFVTILSGPSVTDTPAPTQSRTPTDTPNPQAATFNYTVLLNGIGASGDATNPNSSSLSNKNPNHQQRNVSLLIYNGANQLVRTETGSMDYDYNRGLFTGSITLGAILTNGAYSIRLKTDSYLRKLIPGFQNINQAQAADYNLPQINLIAGDINGDNVIDILDYNMLMGCYSDFLPPTFCDDTKKTLTDLNDDGNVNQIDYNLFLREITVQHGD